MANLVVYVVSADAAVRDSIKTLIESADLSAETFCSLQKFLDSDKSDRRGCLVVDAYVSGLGEAQWQADLAVAYSRMPGILVTDRGDVPTAVRAVKAGAMDVVQKPYQHVKLLVSIKNALQIATTADV